MVRIWNSTVFGRIAALSLVGVLLLAAPAALASYEEGAKAFEQEDYKTAMRILRPLAEQGHADSEHAVGVMIAYGRGVEADAAIGAFWMRRAMLHGSVWAIYDLGVMSYYGEGALPVNANHAILLFEDSAEAGDHRGRFLLAMAYYMGDVVPANPKEAYFNLLLAKEAVPAGHDWHVNIDEALAETRAALEDGSRKWVEGRVATWKSTHE